MPANDQFWRPLSTMHKVFAVSALLLLLATYLMLAKDHRDEWRVYQATADQLKAAQLNDELSEIQTESYRERQQELTEQQAAAEESLKTRSEELEDLRETIAQLQGQVDLKTRNVKFKGAERDVARANYDIAVRDELPDAELQVLKAKFDALQSEVDEMNLDLDIQKRELAQQKARLADETAEYDLVADELKNLNTDAERLEKALANIAPDSRFQRFKRWLMLQPIVDGFNSPHGIHQEWLPDLPITLGMTTTARFDRCRTCHVNINSFEAGNVPAFPHGDFADGEYPHPYSSHPNPDVYLTSTSPHPMPTFGCTICHDGDGSGTSFQHAEHTPDNPAEAEKWHEEYGWHSNHFWEYPMQPDRFVESSCLKCHHSVVELGVNEEYGPTAPKVYEGYELIKSYGCFGCHEIKGYDGDQPIGPDLRLEPGFSVAARQLLADPAFESLPQAEQLIDAASIGTRTEEVTQQLAEPLDEAGQRKLLDDVESLSSAVLHEIRPLAEQLGEDPDLPGVRDSLRELVLAETSLADAARTLRRRLGADEQGGGNGAFLSMVSRGLADAFKSEELPGRERKVGPSLRHIGEKTTAEFIAYWTEMPSRFRPTTKMPQFFHLSNQQDELAERYQPVQIAAMAAYLADKTQPLDTMQPREGYQPDAERGKTLFARRGCLACHQYDDPMFEGATATFGPELTRVHEKIKPGHQPGEDGFNWLYTWVRDPSRHHARTKMPVTYLDPEGEGENYIDPAADITAFLLQGGPREFPALDVDDETLDELVELFARKSLTQADYDQMLAERAFPRDPETIKGDEIELARRAEDPEQISEEEWRHRKMVYVGRRTISFYGCYGCHDIPEFETARPIGTALQDWGRKDTSKLALEHIEEFLHHHTSDFAGTHAGSHDTHEELTVPEIAEEAVEREFHDGDASEDALSTAYFYESLQHHGRPGFIWQKLRQPRSYDYKKIETKGYDERLRMPKFPFTDDQIEAVATFVLGLVAEPPPPEYIFTPDDRQADIIEGNRLLEKYNCVGCHMIDLPQIAYTASPDDLIESELGPADYEQALDLLMELKPPQDGLRRTPTGEPVVTAEGENIVEFKGLLFAAPDPDEDPEFQEYSFDLWETLQVGEKTMFPGSKMLVPAAEIVEQVPARGGDFAQWLVPHLMDTDANGNRFLAWQASPPPLYKEGDKVQTPWLYEFLKNPDRLRFTTVLRMPKFNLSDAEARSLANYFAAADGAVYPYQSIPQQQPPYLSLQEAQFHENFPDEENSYLMESWKLLNAPLCIKCHSVGGNQYQSSDPKKDIRGPNLDRVAKRLRPDWTLLWLYRPAWITPYTSMPTVFPKNQTQLPELFGGDGNKQTIATRDALMNYYNLMEAHGSIAYKQEAATDSETSEEQAQDPQTGSGGR